MIKQSELEQAYRIGVSRALQEAGLTKVAGPFGELLSNPMVSRALIGAGIGGVGGGMTDVGAGRGALAGAAAGAGSAWGQSFGKRMLGKNLAGDLQAARQAGRAAGARGVSSAATSSQKLIGDVANKYGLGSPAWKQKLQNAGLYGSVGAGTLGAGGVLAMTNPPEKPWYQRMF